jgi:hypothetical protein
MATKKNTSVPKSILSKTTQWSNTKTTSTPSLKTVAQNVIGFFQPQNKITSKAVPYVPVPYITGSTNDPNSSYYKQPVYPANASDKSRNLPPPAPPTAEEKRIQGINEFYYYNPDAWITKETSKYLSDLNKGEIDANTFMGNIRAQVQGYNKQLSDRELAANALRTRPRLSARQMGRGQRGYLPPLQRKQYAVRYGRAIQQVKQQEFADIQRTRKEVMDYETQNIASADRSIQQINESRESIRRQIRDAKALGERRRANR